MALCVNRATVHRYQSMSEADFNDFLHKEAQRHGCKLDAYRDFIIQELRDAPFLSSMQVLDHLKEHFPDFPVVSEKTVYNYVMRIREEEGIPKQGEPPRQMHKLPEFEHGEQAQVDWGEQWMSDTSGRRVKVWFFCMIKDGTRGTSSPSDSKIWYQPPTFLISSCMISSHLTLLQPYCLLTLSHQ